MAPSATFDVRLLRSSFYGAAHVAAAQPGRGTRARLLGANPIAAHRPGDLLRGRDDGARPDGTRGHGQMLRCDECVGTVALLRAGDIGRKVWLQPPAGEQVGPFLVIDCAAGGRCPAAGGAQLGRGCELRGGALWGMDRPLDGVTVLADPADRGRWGPSGRSPTPTPSKSRRTKSSSAHLHRRPTRHLGAPPGTDSLAHACSRTLARPPSQPPPAHEPRPTAGPPPLTPMVTTPTPNAPAHTPGGAPPAPGAVTATVAPGQDIAVGRPGGGLLAPASAPGGSGTPASGPSAAPPAPRRPPRHACRFARPRVHRLAPGATRAGAGFAPPAPGAYAKLPDWPTVAASDSTGFAAAMRQQNGVGRSSAQSHAPLDEADPAILALPDAQRRGVPLDA